MIQKQITDTIKDLLLEHNYVCIPQLGGFVSKYSPAKILADKDLIVPPSKKISFNSDLKEDDGLLIHAFANRNHISIQKAESLINSFVQSAFVSLDEGKKVILEKIGSLRFNQHLNIEFESDTFENFNPNSYGLVAVHCQALNTADKINNRNKAVFTRKNFIRAAVVLPFLVMGAILTVYLGQIGILPTTQNQEASIVSPFVNNEQIREAGSPNIVSEQIDFNTTQKNALLYTEPQFSEAEKTESKSNEAVAVNVIPDPIVIKESEKLNSKPAKRIEKAVEVKSESIVKLKGKYQLIAGSFKSEKNANRLSKKISKLNFDTEVVQLGNRFRVIAATYVSKSAAVKAKKKLKQKKVSTWVNTLK